MTAPPRFGHTSDGQPVHARAVDHLPNHTRVNRVNKWIAIKITQGVGTMWCAYAFAGFDVLALPTALRAGLYGVVQWVASFFLQLVLLSIIMVGQNINAVSSDIRNAKQFEDIEKVKSNIVIALDLLDIDTEGGLKVVLDAILALPARDGRLAGEDERQLVLGAADDREHEAVAVRKNEHVTPPS